MVFEFFDEGEDLGGCFRIGGWGGVFRFVNEATGGGNELGGAEGFIYRIEFVGGTDHLGAIVVGGTDVVGSGFESGFKHLVLIHVFEEEDAMAFEHPSDRVGAAQMAAVFREEVADFGGGAVFIIGGGFDEEGDSAWGVTFVHDLLDVAAAIEFSGSFEDCALDVVDGHGFGPGDGDGGTEAGVEAGVASGEAGGDGDLLGQFGKEGASFYIGDTFGAFDFGPATMT